MQKMRAGETYRLAVHLLDKSSDRLTGDPPDLRIKFIKPGDPETGRFWDGTTWAVAPTDLPMVEIDATNQKGSYDYGFTLRVDDHRADGARYLLTVDAGVNALNRYFSDTIDPEPAIGDDLYLALENMNIGVGPAPRGSGLQVIQAVRALAKGTVRTVTTSAGKKIMQWLGLDRATVIVSREVLPTSGTPTELRENDHFDLQIVNAIQGVGETYVPTFGNAAAAVVIQGIGEIYLPVTPTQVSLLDGDNTWHPVSVSFS